MTRREYRLDDFDEDRGVNIVALIVSMLYGVVVGTGGTLFFQWLL